jgi:hypothetical protein
MHVVVTQLSRTGHRALQTVTEAVSGNVNYGGDLVHRIRWGTHERGEISRPRLLIVRVLLLAIVIVTSAGPTWSQAAAEAATATAATGAVGAKSPAKMNPKPVVKPKPASTPPDKSDPSSAAPYLPLSPSESEVEESNRRNLEAKAGSDTALLILRSVPGSGHVWIDGKIVGRTPLFLTLPPASYTIEVRGPRMEVGHGKVDLLPKEKREFVVRLKQRYPAEIHLK